MGNHHQTIIWGICFWPSTFSKSKLIYTSEKLTNGFPGNDGLWKMTLRIQIWRPIGHLAVKSQGVGYNLPYLRLWRPKCDVFLPIKYYSQLGDAKKQPKHHQKATALITHIPLSKTNKQANKQTHWQTSKKTSKPTNKPNGVSPSQPVSFTRKRQKHLPYFHGLWPGRFIGRETVEIRGRSANLMTRCFCDIPKK